MSVFVVVIHHEVSGWNNSRTVRPRITKFHTDIQTDLLYSHTGYDDVTNYFQSDGFWWDLLRTV